MHLKEAIFILNNSPKISIILEGQCLEKAVYESAIKLNETQLLKKMYH